MCVAVCFFVCVCLLLGSLSKDVAPHSEPLGVRRGNIAPSERSQHSQHSHQALPSVDQEWPAVSEQKSH